MDPIATAKPAHPLLGNLSGFELSNIGPLLAEIFFMPGDWIIWLLAAYLPNQAQSLEIGPADYGSLASGIVSGTAWLMVLALALIAAHFIRKAYEAVFYEGLHIVNRSKTRIRTSIDTVKYRNQVAQVSSKPKEAEISTDAQDLTLAELKLLRAHLSGQHFAQMKLEDLAAALSIKANEVAKMVGRLKDMGLLEASKRHGGYALTAAGDAYLSFRQPPARAAAAQAS